MRSTTLLILGCLASLHAADPDKPMYWSAARAFPVKVEAPIGSYNDLKAPELFLT
jgi:hypothetical protein